MPKYLAPLLRGNPSYGVKDADVINVPKNTMITISQCFCAGWSCSVKQKFDVTVSVNGNPTKFEIRECKTCCHKFNGC